MRKTPLFAIALGLAVAASTSTVQAYPVYFATGNTNSTPFNAAVDGSFQTATNNTILYATFNYAGPLNFQVTSENDLNSTFFSNGQISEYQPFNYNTSGFTLPAPANANFSTPSNFLASSASAGGFAYGSILSIDLGTLAAGTVLTIDHDDGASVYLNGGRIGSTTDAPTSEITETVQLTSPGRVFVVYARENGAPSILKVDVPEPASMALLGVGLVGAGFLRRRKV